MGLRENISDLEQGSEAIVPLQFGRGRSEDALASSFIASNPDLRYVAKWGRWLIWKDWRWVEDSTRAVYQRIRRHCRPAVEVSANLVSGVERLARTDERCAATVNQWDGDPWLLNTPSGVVNLHSGQIFPNRPDLYQTKATAVRPSGECPQWMQFLVEVTDNDEHLMKYLQRLSGYALTGSTREHTFAFLHGAGANGKGTFLNALSAIMGDYAVIAPIDILTEIQGQRHPTEIAMLRGARVVIAQETDESRRWAEARIKTITGGDPITARFMRQDFFTFVPQFTCW